MYNDLTLRPRLSKDKFQLKLIAKFHDQEFFINNLSVR